MKTFLHDWLLMGLLNIGSQSSGAVGQIRVEDAASARIGLTKTSSRRYSLGVDGVDFTVRDESAATPVDRLTVASTGQVVAGTNGFPSLGSALHTLIVGQRPNADANGIASLLLNPGTAAGGMGLLFDVSADSLTFRDWGTAGAPARMTLTRAGVLTLGTDEVGYRNVPMTVQNADYTFVAGDRGRGRQKTGTVARNFTVPANVFAAGDVITAFNAATSGNLSILAGSGLTMYLAGSTTVGTRTVAPCGWVTIMFGSPTIAYVSGPGVT